MSGVVLDFAGLRTAVGLDLGHSDWMLVDQPRIDTFADAIDDHQWIHVDPDRAAGTAFGGTIAHGYLSLAAAATRLGELLTVEGTTQIINYGIDKARFPAALPAGTRLRTHAAITDVAEVSGGLQVTARITAEAEGVERPVCVAQVRVRFLS